MTTYAENMGVMAVTRIYSTLRLHRRRGDRDPARLVAEIRRLHRHDPGPVLGGLSIVVFGLIAATAGRIWVENRVDFSNPRNLITVAVALVLGAGNFKLTLGGFTLDGIGTATFGAIILYHLLRWQPAKTASRTTRARDVAPALAQEHAIQSPRVSLNAGLFCMRLDARPLPRASFLQRRERIAASMGSDAQNRPCRRRTQDQQPGRETEMNPRPDYAPRYPGSGRAQGQGRAHHRRRQRHRPRRRRPVRPRRRRSSRSSISTRARMRRRRSGSSRGRGAHCLAIAGDVGDEGFCRRAVEQVIDRFGQLDVLVNNAAEQHPQKEIDEITPEQLERTFRTNIFGYFFMTQAALPHLKEGAAIVNTTSVTAYRGSPELLDYSATKGAIVAFTRSLAKKLVEKGIRVNGVAPGPIWTPLIPSTFSAEKVASFGATRR